MSRVILLADDSVTIQKVIELTFMDEDYRVVAVGNGDEALARLSDSSPDFVIADVHMPGATGYEVCRRSKEQHPSVPVLLLVGTFEPFDEAKAQSAGADAFLKKPFDSQELLRLVEELTVAGGGGQAAPEAAAGAGGAVSLEDWAEPEGPEVQPPPEMETAAPEADEGAGEEPDETPPEDAEGGPWEADEAPEPTPVWHNLDDSLEAALEAPADEAEDEGELSFEDVEIAYEDGEVGDDEERPARPAGFEVVSDEDLPAAAPELEAAGEPDADDADEPSEATDEPWEVEVRDADLPAAAAEEPEPEALELAAEEGTGTWEPIVREEGEDAAEEPPPPTPDLPGGEATPFAAASTAPPEAPAAEAEAEPEAEAPAPSDAPRLSDEDVDRIARRVAELLSSEVLREVAWEVVPDLAEVAIKDRLRELEAQLE